MTISAENTFTISGSIQLYVSLYCQRGVLLITLERVVVVLIVHKPPAHWVHRNGHALAVECPRHLGPAPPTRSLKHRPPPSSLTPGLTIQSTDLDNGHRSASRLSTQVPAATSRCRRRRGASLRRLHPFRDRTRGAPCPIPSQPTPSIVFMS
jgi:hypothetical protein